MQKDLSPYALPYALEDLAEKVPMPPSPRKNRNPDNHRRLKCRPTTSPSIQALEQRRAAQWENTPASRVTRQQVRHALRQMEKDSRSA